MPTPKVALCISGQMRTYTQCFPSIKRYLLDPLQPEVFIHTWTETGVANQPKRSLPSILLRTAEKHPSLKKHVNRFVKLHHSHSQEGKAVVSRPEIESLYHPKQLVIEDFPHNGHWSLFGTTVPGRLRERIIELDRSSDDNFMAWRGVLGGLPMFYKIYSCNQMVKEWQENNNINYDLVVRLRPDIELTDEIPISTLESAGGLCFSTIKNPDNYSTKNRVSDQLFWGPPELMDIISEIWLHLPEYYCDMANDPSRSIYGAERVLAYHCQRLGIGLSPYSIHSHIVREKRNYQNITKTIYRMLQSK